MNLQEIFGTPGKMRRVSSHLPWAHKHYVPEGVKILTFLRKKWRDEVVDHKMDL